MQSKSWNSFYNSILPAVSFGALTGVLTSLAVNLYKACAKFVIGFSEKSYHFIGERLYLLPLVLIAFLLPAFFFAYIYKRIPNLRGGGIPTSIGILRYETEWPGNGHEGIPWLWIPWPYTESAE